MAREVIKTERRKRLRTLFRVLTMTKVTRIIESKNLNRGKYEQLVEQAGLLGKIRKEVWQRFGSINGVGLKHRAIRDQWIGSRDFSPLAAKAWKETLRDTMQDIKLYEEAAKVKVRKAIKSRFKTEKDLKRAYGLLKGNRWKEDPYLSRMMRKHKRHGKTDVHNQIIVEYGVYRQFIGKDGKRWIKVPSLARGKMMCIPLNCKILLRGCLRIIMENGKVFVHHTIDQKKFEPCGGRIIGVDKGYTEAFADSEGDFHGEGFGELLTRGTEARNRKGKARNKLYQIAKKKPRKAKNIYKFNLGQKK